MNVGSVKVDDFAGAQGLPQFAPRPSCLDWIIPSSIKLDLLPFDYEKRSIVIESDAYHQSPLNDMMSDRNEGGGYFHVLAPRSPTVDMISQCNSLGEVIEQILELDQREDKAITEALGYFMQIAKAMHVNEPELKAYLVSQNFPVHTVIPVEPLRTKTESRKHTVYQLALERIASVRQNPEPDPRRQERRHRRCTIL